MTARTHDAVAFATLLTVAAYFPPQNLSVTTLGAAIVGNIVGSLLPDMDQAGNRLWDLLPAGDHLARVLRKAFISHRTLSHSFVGLFLFYHILGFVLYRLLNPNYVDVNIVFIAMMVGYISHLVADSLTKEGLPLLWPLKWKFGFPPVSAFRITTGSWVENFVVLPAVAAYIFWFIGKNQQSLIKIVKLIAN